jgi:hypothetical protein
MVQIVWISAARLRCSVIDMMVASEWMAIGSCLDMVHGELNVHVFPELLNKGRTMVSAILPLLSLDKQRPSPATGRWLLFLQAQGHIEGSYRLHPSISQHGCRSGLSPAMVMLAQKQSGSRWSGG